MRKNVPYLLRTLAGLVPLALAAATTPAYASQNNADVIPVANHPRGLTGDQQGCPIDDLSVPESAGGGVVTEWIAYGQTLTVEPYGDQIWAGVWFTGTNGPEGWTSTNAPSYYPAPGVPEYSLVARLGNGAYEYVGASTHRYTNTTSGYLQRVRFKVNDNTPGNGSGAFKVFLRYPCVIH
jgi:hypothetical protein